MDSVTRIVLQKAKVEADNDQTADEVNPDVTWSLIDRTCEGRTDKYYVDRMS